MNDTLKFTIFVIGIIFDFIVFFLLLKRRVNERSSLPWIASSFIIMLFSLTPNLLGIIARTIGVSYPPALLFLIAILVILLLILYQAIQISILQNKCQELAQNLAIICSVSNIKNIKIHSHISGSEENNYAFLMGNSKLTVNK